MRGPVKEATPWKPWLRFNRADAYFSVPRTEIYEFAATSRVDRPHPVANRVIRSEPGVEHDYSPITKVDPTNPPYASNFADGQKKIAPSEYNVSPT